eukprot:SAG22_NODE_151_length_17414_cov_7.812128_2_plen_244_part_00
MPKKANQKAVAANERKTAVADAKKAAEAAAAEDAAWADNRKAKKHEVKKLGAEEKAAAKLARKAADKALAAEEEEMMAASPKPKGDRGGKGKAGGGVKMTQAMINQAKTMRAEKEAKALRKHKQAAAKVVDETDYANMVDSFQGNMLGGADGGGASGRGIDGALGALGGDKARVQALAVAAGAEAGSKGANAAAQGKITFKVFEGTRLPALKADKPGLKASQYRDLCKKEWSRSPLNPANQKA